VAGLSRPAASHAFETRLLLGFAGIAVVGALAVSLIRLREEVVSFDLSTGAMRIDRYLGGFQYGSEAIDSHLGWIATLEPTARPAHWVVLSERHDGSLLRGPRYQRRIGLVHLDACILAQAIHGRDLPSLRQTMRDIAAADSDRIWSLRQGLREAFERRLQPVDRQPPADTTTACPATR